MVYHTKFYKEFMVLQKFCATNVVSKFSVVENVNEFKTTNSTYIHITGYAQCLN
jgi:hypothetical protein